MIKDIVRPVAECWGFNKATQKLTNRITIQVNRLVEKGQLWLHKDFIWSSREQWENWKVVRQPIDGKKRKIEQIPGEEIAVAVEWIVSQSFSIDEDALYREIASLLSVGKLSEKARQKMQATVDLVCQRGKAQREASRVVWKNLDGK